jgi:protein-S-isoprenylcysteine O-methyltransferase Ste14
VDDDRGARGRAALQSVAFLVVAPGMVAGLLPWLITGWSGSSWDGWRVVGTAVGWFLIAAGSAVLVHAFALFVLQGLGTPAPIAPTRTLVVTGTYRWVRNPMYLAVTAVIVGQALLFASVALGIYAVVVATAFVTFVNLYEQPTLTRQFRADYEAYLRTVPGWWPRRPRT